VARPESKKPEPSACWRDTDSEVEGPAVPQFQHLFINLWNHQQEQLLQIRDCFPKIAKQGNQIVRVIGSAPERFGVIYFTLISAIVNSATNVYITDVYFAPYARA
jgi:cardiolipin synthase